MMILFNDFPQQQIELGIWQVGNKYRFPLARRIKNSRVPVVP